VDNSLIIEYLRDRISELKSSLPAHSISPAMLIELEELLKEVEGNNSAAA